MKLVEVIRGANTTDETFKAIFDLSLAIGKEPVEVVESPGFIVNRILVPMINEGAGLYETGVASVEDIDKALDQVTKATSMLRAQASEFGQSLSTVQIREDFTTNMIKNLTTGADKLTRADTNEEAANLLALQTRQSLATTSLSLANQSAQGVLRLF